MEVTLAGRVMLVRPDCWKALILMLPSELPTAKVIVFNEEHNKKEDFPMEVTLAGIDETKVSPDPEKADSPILPSKLPLVKVSVFSEEHAWKACCAIVDTLAGMVIAVSAED